MKKLVFGLMMLFIVGAVSSCVSNRGCNGSWYNNRNVQVEPKKEKMNSLDFEEIMCKIDNNEYTE